MRPGFILLSFVFCYLFGVTAWGELQAGAQSQAGSPPATTRREERQRREVQPGATQGAVLTDVTDAQPKFNMDYFVGEWDFESNVSEGPLGAGGPISGSETVRNVLDGRFWDITIKGEGPEGPFTGKGIITYQDSFSGQSYMRYEITQGIALLKSWLRSRGNLQPVLRNSTV